VWSFGALVFEMLTGRRLFDGETVSDVLAAVLTRQPEWTSLARGGPGRRPRVVRRMLERCLERDPKLRLRDHRRSANRAGERSVRRGFWPVPLSAASARAPGLPAARRASPRPLLLVAAYERQRPKKRRRAAAVAQARAGRRGLHYTSFGRLPPSHPAAQPHSTSALASCGFAELSELQPRELPQTEERFTRRGLPRTPRRLHPAWPALERALDGGQPSELGEAPADLAGSGGTAWSEDGVIVVAGSDRVGLFAIPAKGGQGRDIAPLDRSKEADYHEVSALPGGRGFLFTVHRQEGLDTVDVLANGKRRTAAPASRGEPALAGLLAHRPHPLPPGVHEPWHLGNRLLARHADRFGSAVPRLPRRLRAERRERRLARARARLETPSELVWVGRDGAVEKAADLPGPANDAAEGLAALALSVDGRRAASTSCGGLRRHLGVRSREGLDLAA
jgi:hypothetical protein